MGKKKRKESINKVIHLPRTPLRLQARDCFFSMHKDFSRFLTCLCGFMSFFCVRKAAVTLPPACIATCLVYPYQSPLTNTPVCHLKNESGSSVLSARMGRVISPGGGGKVERNRTEMDVAVKASTVCEHAHCFLAEMLVPRLEKSRSCLRTDTWAHILVWMTEAGQPLGRLVSAPAQVTVLELFCLGSFCYSFNLMCQRLVVMGVDLLCKVGMLLNCWDWLTADVGLVVLSRVGWVQGSL